MEDFENEVDSLSIEERQDLKSSTGSSDSRGKSRGGSGSGSRGRASKIFDCSYNQCAPFKGKIDPFNPTNRVDGYICKKDGAMGGSLYITNVNGTALKEPEIIYGTPKLEYPYQDFESQDYKNFAKVVPQCSEFILANKWNGTNVMVFKYKDAKGNVFVSAKSKGAPFLNNSPFGAFLQLTREALRMRERDEFNLDKLPAEIREVKENSVQSKTFELCGRKEPHLVDYDFDLALKPLFLTYMDGTIAPCKNDDDIGPFKFDPKNLVEECSKYQKEDYQKNQKYREEKKLPLRYEFNYFAIEGRVLYLLDSNGKLLKRTMYKIKPKDIEEVHWSNFDSNIQGRTREAIEKIILRGKTLDQKALQEELDMGPKEWGRFGKDVTKYALELTKGEIPSRINDKRHVLVIGGYPGSGRSEFVEEILKRSASEGEEGWYVLGRGPFLGNDVDEIKKQIENKFKKNCKIIIDTANVTLPQRRAWVELALKYGVLRIDCVFFDVPKEDCMKKVESDPKGKKADKNFLSEAFKANVNKPQHRDGFSELFIVKNKEEINKALEYFAKQANGNNANKEEVKL